MIITCASCLTKFNLDDARIPPKGAQVRCSRCRHIFHVQPAYETKEEARYGDYHEVLPGPGRKEVKPPLPIEQEDEIEEPLLSEIAPPVEPEQKAGEDKKEERKSKVFTAKKSARRERRGPSLFFIVFAIVVLLVFIAFYLLGEFGSEGKFFRYLEHLFKKITELFQ